MSNQEELDEAFLKAAWEGDLTACSAALEGCADLCIDNACMREVVVHAFAKGRVDIVRLLLKQDEAVANAVDGNGWTLLHYNSAEPEFLELLLAHGALPSLNVTDDWGATPLFKAGYNNYIESMRVLLRAGADPLVKNISGETVRDDAVKCGRAHARVIAVLDEFIALVSKGLPTFALTLEELERSEEIFVPREIVNLFLLASFQFSF